MSIKQEIRNKAKLERKNIQDKNLLSSRIVDKFLSSSLYKNSKTVLCYSPINDEVDTSLIISNAIQDGKILALPYCVDDNGIMDFYIVENYDKQTVVGSYGIIEPNINLCKRLENFDNSVIIVPALCFNEKGYRLGYGKGYYDRFLEKHSLISVGLCYNSLVKNEIPIDKYDKPVNFILTESQIIACENGGSNGKFE